MMMPNANKLAKLLHPNRQQLVIDKIIDITDSMKIYQLKSAENKELAYFEAGSYLPVFVEIDGNVIERPYSLCSSPKESEEGFYSIMIKPNNNGYVSNYIFENWKEGMEVSVGGPHPAETYNPVRDSKNVIALAGGSGVSPFISMAKAIVDGDIDCNLSVFYGVNKEQEIVDINLWKELEAKSNGKVKAVFVVLDTDCNEFEKGFITLDIIKKYCDPKNASFFISGPPLMVKAMVARM